MWRTRDPVDLDGASMRALFNNEIPAIRISAFASRAECESLLQVLGELDFRSTHFNPPTVQRVGPSYYGFRERKHAYFQAARQCDDIWRRIAAYTMDPVTRLVRFMGGIGVDLRRPWEPGYGYYAPAFIKKRTGSQLLHTDTATMMDGWMLQENISQVAWNLYLQVTDGRDSTVVYNRGERPGDERCASDPPGYYTEELIRDVESATLWPETGDVILFNSSNYHRVRGCATVRVTIGGFIGRTPHGEVIHWA